MTLYDGTIRVPLANYTKNEDVLVLIDRFTFENKNYTYAQKAYKNTQVPRFLKLFHIQDTDMVFPRGALQWVSSDLKESIYSEQPLSFLSEFKGELRDYQKNALQALLDYDNGYLRMPTGSGKTVVMLAAVCAYNQKTLVLVHTKDLLNQWVDRFQRFTNITPGKLGSGKKDIEEVTVAIYKSVDSTIINQFSVVVVDEAHHSAAPGYLHLLMSYKGPHLYGCTATDITSQGIPAPDRVIGPKLYDMQEQKIVKTGAIIQPNYFVISTPYRVNYDGTQPYIEMALAISENPDRNAMITKLTKRMAENNRTILILTQFVEHGHTLKRLLNDQGCPCQFIYGEMNKNMRQAAIDDTAGGSNRILIGTTIADEGLDIPIIDTLILAAPSKFKGRFLQRIGRALRPLPDKTTAEIYDIVEMQEPLFKGQFYSRLNALKEFYGIKQYHSYTL